MSLTSYRAAPPRDIGFEFGIWFEVTFFVFCFVLCFVAWLVRSFIWPGGDLLSHALRRSTIGAEGFHGRVRDGIECFTPRHNHQTVKKRVSPVL